jgi:hypothetical protein
MRRKSQDAVMILDWRDGWDKLWKNEEIRLNDINDKGIDNCIGFRYYAWTAFVLSSASTGFEIEKRCIHRVY